MKKKSLAMLLAVVTAAGLLPGTARAADGDGRGSAVTVETLVEPVYDEADSFGSDENGDPLYAAVRVDGKWGYVDLTGRMVIQPQYDYAAPFREGVAIVAKQLYDTYDLSDWEAGEAYEVTDPGGCRLYLLSADGRETALQKYSYSSDTDSYEYEDYIIYNSDWDYELGDYVTVDPIDSRWGCCGGVVYAGYPYLPDGTPIIPKNLSSLLPSGHDKSTLSVLSYDSPGSAPVMWGPCVNGVIPMRVEYGWEDRNGSDSGVSCFYMDAGGNITRVFPAASYYAGGADGVYSAYAPDGTGLAVVEYGRWLSDGYWDEEETYINGEFGAKYGAMRADGSWAVSPACASFRYFTGGMFFSQGLWVVSKDGGKWGAVDASGNEVIPFQYDSMTSFSGDLAAVQKDGQWYYIDMHNNAYRIGAPEGGVADRILIASHFSGHIAAVYDGERAYCIVNTPVDGVLPAVQGAEELAMSVYFPDYGEYLETGELGLVSPVDEYSAIERDGKWGFLKLTFALEDVNPFEDIHLGDYYYDPVQWAVKNGITQGASEDGTLFSPNSDCTRAQTVTFLWRAYGKPEYTSAENPFTDVSEDDWFYDAVLWAYGEGIVNGAGDGTVFNPNGACSRKDAVTFQYRAAGSPPVTGGSSFSDVTEGDYYADAVAWAAANGITLGNGEGAFGSDQICRRSQVVTFLFRDPTIPDGTL